MKLLFPKEEEIMYAIWDIGHPCVISDILKQRPELKRNTVAKVIIILEQKGYVAVDSIVKTITRTGRSYKPVITKEDYEAQKNLMENIIESPDAQQGILNYCTNLINTSNVSEEFVQEIEKLITEFKSKEN